MDIAKYIAAIAVILLLIACEKEVDFNYHEIAPVKVVEATLSQDGASVAITMTTPMNEPIPDIHITDASVLLCDLTSEEKFFLEPTPSGLFHSDVAGIPGHDYRLIIKVEGQTFESATTMLNAVEIIDTKFLWIKMPGDDMAALRILFTDNPVTSAYYWIRIYRNGEHYQWSIINDHASADGQIEETLTTTHRDASKEEDEKSLLVDGDVLTVSVTAVDRSMFDYLIALTNSSNGAPQYSGDFCLGYFLASPVATSSITYHPDEIRYAK